MKISNKWLFWLSLGVLALLLILGILGIWVGASLDQLRRNTEQIIISFPQLPPEALTLIGQISTKLGGITIIVVIMLVMVFFASIAVLLSVASDFLERRRLSREIKKLQREWHEQGIQTGILKTTETLDLDPSVLRNIMSWIYDYSQGYKNPDAAFDLFTQLIARFSFLNFKPIGQIGEIVNFDPHIHRNLDPNVNPGDRAIIVETGWTLDQKIIRKPLIEVYR